MQLTPSASVPGRMHVKLIPLPVETAQRPESWGRLPPSALFYDSVLDRVGDGATLMGIGLFLLTTDDPVALRNPAIAMCMVAIIASLTASYAGARADGLGIDCTVGIAQRSP